MRSLLLNIHTYTRSSFKAIGSLLGILLLLSLSACAPTSGILSSTGNWQASGPVHQHIRALAVQPNKLNKLYAGDEQGNVFVSTDSGLHWTERSTGLLLPNAIHALVFDESGKQLYAATEKGIFLTTDEGQQWHTLNTPTSGLPITSYTALALGTNPSQLIYAATANQGVFMSTNGGNTWTQGSTTLAQGTTINDLVLDLDKQQIWVATSSGVYRSDDKGSSWHALNTGLPDNVIVNTVRLASMSGGPQGVVYLGTSQGFFRSNDAGGHWTPSIESLAHVNVLRILVDFRSTDASTVFISTNVGAFRSDDGGQNWRGIAGGLPQGKTVYALALGADGYSQTYAALDQIYQYPGTGGGISPTRIISIILLALFFYLLYRLIQRGRTRHRKTFTFIKENEKPAAKAEGEATSENKSTTQ